MRWWQTVLLLFLALAALVACQMEEEEEYDYAGLRGLVLAAAPAAAASQAPAHGGNNAHASNDKEKAATAAAKGGKPSGEQQHDAGKSSGAHDKPAPAAKKGEEHGTPTEKSEHGDKDKEHSNGDGEAKKGHTKHLPSKTHKSDDEQDDENDEEAEKEYLKRVKADKDAGKLPGRMKMIVPPRTVHTPLFELDSVVELKWEYDNNVIEVPEKLMISVQLPKDPHDPGAKPVLYDIAVNVTGDKKTFFWDTKNDVPEGVGMREGSGYTMFFYDGDIGFRMSDVVPAGYLIKYAMPFAFYISRYERTNDGVPKNYNPNSAGRTRPDLAVLGSVLALSISALAGMVGI